MAEKVSIDQFKRINIVVAKILSCDEIPNSKKLFLLRVDLGDFGRRQIVSGLKGLYDPGELIGKKILVLENLEPAVIMGFESQGMLLAVNSKKGVFVIEPFDLCEPGDKVT